MGFCWPPRDRSSLPSSTRCSERRCTFSASQLGITDCDPPSEIDILTVGGSTTDQRFLDQQTTFQAILQRELSRLAGQEICVSNAGVDGHSTHGHLRAFRDWFPLIPGLRPKLFVFSLGINDADFTRQGPAEFENEVLGAAVKKLQVVQLGLWLRDLVKSKFGVMPIHVGHQRVEPQPSDYTQAELAKDTAERAARNAEGFRERLRRMIRHAGEMGGEVICVTQPHRFVRTANGARLGLRAEPTEQRSDTTYGGLDYDAALRLLNQVMREECGEDRLVDMYNAEFDGEDFYDFVHTTPSGARKIGQRLARFIAASDLMKTVQE